MIELSVRQLARSDLIGVTFKSVFYLSITSGVFIVNWVISIDNLVVPLVILVALVSTVVYFYSVFYMFEDPHLVRFS